MPACSMHVSNFAFVRHMHGGQLARMPMPCEAYQCHKFEWVMPVYSMHVLLYVSIKHMHGCQLVPVDAW